MYIIKSPSPKDVRKERYKSILNWKSERNPKSIYVCVCMCVCVFVCKWLKEKEKGGEIKREKRGFCEK